MEGLNPLVFDTSDSDTDSDQENSKTKLKEYRPRLNFTPVSDFQFKEKFRITRDKAEYILTKIGPRLKHSTKNSMALTPDQQLLVTLHWFGTGAQYHAVADMHCVDKATVCRAIKRVVKSVVSELFQSVVRFPTNNTELALEFYGLKGFPSVCGCVDGSLINIQSPSVNEAAFVDRHGNHSLNMMAVCGADMKFYYISSRWPGSVGDSRVLRNTSLFQDFESGWRPFADAVILGDSAYPNLDWLVTPLGDSQDSGVRQYNRAHKATRRIIECAFGLMKQKFPCLNYLRLDPIYAGQVILAATTFHNIALDEDDHEFLEYVSLTEDQIGPTQVVQGSSGEGRIARLLNHFAGEN